eukprot:scaffold127422_cov54-Phaeocystis_antarctica.AAC.2
MSSAWLHRVRVRVRVGVRMIRIRIRVRARVRVSVARMRSACTAHSSTQTPRRALVARAEVRQMGWPYLSNATGEQEDREHVPREDKVAAVGGGRRLVRVRVGVRIRTKVGVGVGVRVRVRVGLGQVAAVRGGQCLV